MNLRGEIKVIEFEKEQLFKVCYPFMETDIIQMINFPSLGVSMLIDEEGKMKNDNNPNLDATFLYMREYIVQDIIMGHVVFVSQEADEEGWTMGLTDEKIEELTKLINKIQSKRPAKAFATTVLPTDPRGE